jgi:hypothetical protein
MENDKKDLHPPRAANGFANAFCGDFSYQKT